LTVDDKARFGELLELSDPELQAYLLGTYDADDPNLDRLLRQIRADFHS
jgi:succinate dehydrogenase flavin-adding protein (antitoxin of CptAB toxin-antitoxin module)